MGRWQTPWLWVAGRVLVCVCVCVCVHGCPVNGLLHDWTIGGGDGAAQAAVERGESGDSLLPTLVGPGNQKECQTGLSSF